ncbi:hypothetical protein PsYK624_108090 [Phanerochaete sordida]|uniref:Uncharacterized protein n=1 Tax=Phanerochaete sordida TaxID=48140 RepID=A0A9P3GEK8_9APHY|nr:hypothetical protein PsYK624_108090 [Phanerochaete sordida]
MPPSSFAKHRFQNSLDLAAARAMRTGGRVAQSGTGNAWCIEDSPTLGHMLSPREDRPAPAPAASGSGSSSGPGSRLPFANTAPLNIKKIRRRGLSNGVQLVLPPSPLPLGGTGAPLPSPPSSSSHLAPPTHLSPPASVPGSALTFTAEWDRTQMSFVFAPLEPEPPHSAGSARSMPSTPSPRTPLSAWGARPVRPLPPVPHTAYPHRARHPPIPTPLSAPARRPRSAVVVDADADGDEADAGGSASEPGTPVSPLFDAPLFDTPRYAHARKASQSTAASSVTDLTSPEDAPAPPPKDAAPIVPVAPAVPVVPRPKARSAPEAGARVSVRDRVLEEELVDSPMGMSEHELRGRAASDAQRAEKTREQEPRDAYEDPPWVHRRLPSDVPSTAGSSAFSVYSDDYTPYPAAGSPSKGSLRTQISKALSSTLLFRR